MIRQFDNLMQLVDAFPDEQAAVDNFTALRWKDGAYCPHCGSTKVYHFSDKRTHKCGDCRKRFSIKVGTIFEDSKIALRKWFMAIWLITSHKKGIASTQLAKDIGVTQKTAWFMLHRLRHAAMTKSFNQPLTGTVEADETYVGGRNKNRHASKRKSGRGSKGKAVVFGLLERGNEIRAFHVPDMKADNVHGIIGRHVAEGANIMTDEHASFVGLQGRYHHHSVNHSAGEYVRHFYAHINGIEGAWALLKRQIIGIHHWVSDKHLSRYIGEMTWRYNRRDLGEGERVNALLAATDGRLRYQELTA